MRKRDGAIPVNNFGGEAGGGISIERISFEHPPDDAAWERMTGILSFCLRRGVRPWK